MPSLVAPFDVYPSLRDQSASRLADPNTGVLVARTSWGVVGTNGSVVGVGKRFELPADAIAVNCYATIDVDFEVGSWAGFLGYGYGYASSVIELVNQATHAGRAPGEMLGRAESWIGGHSIPRQTRTIHHVLRANWGTPTGAVSAWEVMVYLICLTNTWGIAGAWANASTRVRNIDFEVLWRA
jgi:hypothetical protein